MIATRNHAKRHRPAARCRTVAGKREPVLRSTARGPSRSSGSHAAQVGEAKRGRTAEGGQAPRTPYTSRGMRPLKSRRLGLSPRAAAGPCFPNTAAVRSASSLSMVLIGLAAFWVAAATALAQDKTRILPAPAKIGSLEASSHYGETVVVTGKVAGVKFAARLVYVDLDRPFPKTPFAAVIYNEDTNRFGDLRALEGRSVEMKGKIEQYRNMPEMKLSSSNQLRIVEAKLPPAPAPSAPGGSNTPPAQAEPPGSQTH
jgi:hypothetical protein